MFYDTHALMVTISPNKGIPDVQDGMAYLIWSRVFLTDFGYIKIQICHIKHMKI